MTATHNPASLHASPLDRLAPQRNPSGGQLTSQPDRAKLPIRKGPHAGVANKAEKVEAAVKRPEQKAIGDAEGRHFQALNGALADAQQKMAAQGA